MPIFIAETQLQRSAVDRFLDSKIKAPYVYTQVSTLGGTKQASAIVKVSLDPKSRWVNGILQNSRYAMFHLHRSGDLEMFSGSLRPRMRRSKTLSLLDAVARINRYLSSVK